MGGDGPEHSGGVNPESIIPEDASGGRKGRAASKISRRDLWSLYRPHSTDLDKRVTWEVPLSTIGPGQLPGHPSLPHS